MLLFIFKENEVGYPDAGIGVKAETCSYCKQKDFLTLMMALV